MTNSTSEADDDQVVQPRLPSEVQPSCSSASWNWVWMIAVSLVVVGVGLLTIQTAPNIHDAPPTLQTFVKAKVRPSAAPIVRSTRKSAAEPLVRVNVTPGGAKSFELEVRGPYRLMSLDNDEKFPADLISHRVAVTSTSQGLKLGSRQCTSSRIEIVPDQSPAIRVNGHLYRGRMKLYRRTDGQVSAINIVPVEEYLGSVVDSEMPAKFPDAARKAQAIVARTYALYQAQQADPNSVYDLLSSQRSQKYLGVEYVDSTGRRLAGESENSRRAVKETRGIVCTWHKKLFCTYYSAVCGGRTTDGDEVFKDAVEALKSVPCEWCSDSPHYRWTTEVSRKDFQQRAVSQGKNAKTVSIRSIRQTTEPGRGSISRFELDDGKQRPNVNGIELRDRMPAGTLFSPHFHIKLEKDRVVFEGRGHGHGVGFCQWGAKGQAEMGRSHPEIIRHYYPGTELTDLDY